MEMRPLKVFCAVAESGSLVAAAGRLHLTPSAISHSLKALETDLGCRLFERVGKRMVLNQAGDQLLAAVREPLAALDSAAEGIKRLGQWGQSRLRIAAPVSVCEHILPKVIRELKKTEPSMELQVQSGGTPHVLDLVRQNKIDLALCLIPENPLGLDIRPVFRDELMLVCAANHSWAAGKPITPEAFSSEPFISQQRTSVTAQLFMDYCERQSLSPRVLMEVESIGAIIEMVKFNLGVAILAPWMVETELARGTVRLRSLGTRPLKRQWAVVSLAVRPKTYTEETFCRLCRNQAAAMRLDRKDLPESL